MRTVAYTLKSQEQCFLYVTAATDSGPNAGVGILDYQPSHISHRATSVWRGGFVHRDPYARTAYGRYPESQAMEFGNVISALPIRTKTFSDLLTVPTMSLYAPSANARFASPEINDSSRVITFAGTV